MPTRELPRRPEPRSRRDAGREVRARARDRVEVGAPHGRHVHERADPVGARPRTVPRNHLGNVGQPPQEGHERRLAAEDDAGAPARDQGCVAREVDRVAQPLLGVEQDRPPGEVLAFPGAAAGGVRQPPQTGAAAAHVVRPRGGIASRQEIGAGAYQAGVVVIGVGGQDLAGARQPRLEAALVDQGMAERGEHYRVPRRGGPQLPLVVA